MPWKQSQATTVNVSAVLPLKQPRAKIASDGPSPAKLKLERKNLKMRVITAICFLLGVISMAGAAVNYPHRSVAMSITSVARSALSMPLAVPSQRLAETCPLHKLPPAPPGAESAYSWVALPGRKDMDWFRRLHDLLQARPTFSSCCPQASSKVLQAAKGVNPLGRPYDQAHDHFNRFWLVAHALIAFLPSCGLTLEFGVAQGSSATLTGGILENRPEPPRVLHGFDTFSHDMPTVPSSVKLIKGPFQDTLPRFLYDHQLPLAYAHINCDTYTGAIFVLRQLRQRLRPGSLLHFHDINQPHYGISDELQALYGFLTDEPNLQLEFLNVNAWAEAALIRVVSI